ncbi:MAG: YdbC family protein [Aminipila sp.]
MSMENKNEEVTFEIVEHIGVIAEYKNKWSKELNRISWNGGNPKFDIRDWDEKHEHMSRGITIHGEEMVILFDLLKSVFNEVEVESCGA